MSALKEIVIERNELSMDDLLTAQEKFQKRYGITEATTVSDLAFELCGKPEALKELAMAVLADGLLEGDPTERKKAAEKILGLMKPQGDTKVSIEIKADMSRIP